MVRSTETSGENIVFRLKPEHVSSFLWLTSFIIVAAGLAREWYVTRFGTETFLLDLRHLAFNAEYCLPAWYTSLLLVAAAALLTIVTASAARSGERYLIHWAILAIMFLGLSVDEATGVHEVAIDPLRSGLGLGGFFHFAWVIPGLILVSLVGLAYLPFLFAQPSRTRLVFFIAGLLYVGGALGMELVGGKLLTVYGEASLPYQIAYCTEEIMEILGATLFATGLIGHLKRRYGGAALVMA